MTPTLSWCSVSSTDATSIGRAERYPGPIRHQARLLNPRVYLVLGDRHQPSIDRSGAVRNVRSPRHPPQRFGATVSSPASVAAARRRSSYATNPERSAPSSWAAARWRASSDRSDGGPRYPAFSNTDASSWMIAIRSSRVSTTPSTAGSCTRRAARMASVLSSSLEAMISPAVSRPTTQRRSGVLYRSTRTNFTNAEVSRYQAFNAHRRGVRSELNQGRGQRCSTPTAARLRFVRVAAGGDPPPGATSRLARPRVEDPTARPLSRGQ